MGVHPQPRVARAARSPREPAPAHPAAPTTHEREGRTLPPDDGPRVGLRAHLPLTPRARRCPATLAPPLQPAQATLLARRPTPRQPRSQRLWVGHLVSVGEPMVPPPTSPSFWLAQHRPHLTCGRMNRPSV